MQDLKVWAYDDIFNPVTDLNSNFEKVKDAIEANAEAIEPLEESDINVTFLSGTTTTTITDAKLTATALVQYFSDDPNIIITSVSKSVGTMTFVYQQLAHDVPFTLVVKERS